MSGSVEFGKCEVCGKGTILQRTYWHYNIKCECHSPNHVEMIRHCKDCVPIEPKITKIDIRTDQLKLSQSQPAISEEEIYNYIHLKREEILHPRGATMTTGQMTLGELTWCNLCIDVVKHFTGLTKKDGAEEKNLSRADQVKFLTDYHAFLDMLKTNSVDNTPSPDTINNFLFNREMEKEHEVNH